MALLRDEGRIDDHTYLIDTVHGGVKRGIAVYLLKSTDGGSCLIDAGTKSSAETIWEKLSALNAWPVDRIILTHSHYDHTQGVEYLRKRAKETGDTLDVFASEKALPYLADQSYNICFGMDQSPYLNIAGVSGLKDGDRIAVGEDLTVTVVDTPGHMVDHISVLNEESGSIIVGDAIGMKWSKDLLISNPNSTFWNEKDFLSTVDTIKRLDVNTIGLAHFGCLTGGDAAGFLDDTAQMYQRWMDILSAHMDRIDDIPFLVDVFIDKVYGHLSERLKEVIRPGLADPVGMAAGAYAKQHA